MSELYDTSETAEPASEAGSATWQETSSGPESADNSRSDPDAAQRETDAGEGDYGSYSDADLDAMLTEEETLPEPLTRQEAAADTWDDTADDATGSEPATEYDGDLEALLADEETLPEPRTRYEAAADTWKDTTDPDNDDPESFSGDPASEYDGDVEALLAEEENLPEPLTRQEAAADTWRDTSNDEDADLAANTDSANLSEFSSRQEATEEAQASLTQSDAVTESPTAPAQADEAPEPYARQVAVHIQDGKEVPITVEYLPPEARTVGDDTPTGIGLKPAGEQLSDMEDDSMSRFERLRHHLYKEADDIMDVAEKSGNRALELFDHPPTETHTVVPIGQSEITTPEQHTVEGGHLVTAGLVLGILGYEAARAVKHRIDTWKGRRR